MKRKFKFSLILMLICLTTYSQLLPDTEVIFKNFNGYSKLGNNLFGNLLKSGEANTKISISSIGIKTYIVFESTLFNGGEQVYIVSNLTKKNKLNKVICDIETYNGQDPNPKKKIVQFIFEYIDNNLTKVIFPNSGGAFEFF